MQPDEELRVAHSWLEVQRHWWAWEQVHRLSEGDPHAAWSLLGTLVDLADSDELLGDIGAGPLEDFVRAHATQFIRELEMKAATDPRFRRLLSNVLIPSGNDEVSRRLVELGCQPLPPKAAP